jgi:hypothetical protein
VAAAQVPHDRVVRMTHEWALLSGREGQRAGWRSARRSPAVHYSVTQAVDCQVGGTSRLRQAASRAPLPRMNS